MNLKMLFADRNEARSKVGAPAPGYQLAAILVILVFVGILMLF